ncbi:MAG TPA: transaldolase [Gemmatimonadales bacterium]|nr:transaldolase [Gemmatimonadales bacterium]
MTNPLVALGQLGQSPWYDFITRDLVRSGELARLIREDGLLGMTSNPTIFEKAVAGSSDYDDDIRRLTAQGLGAAEVFEALAVADVQAACDLFRPVWDARATGDGTVSLEVAPTLARDAAGTVAEAQRLWDRVARPNVMIKIPGTAEGLAAIEECVARGINVNVTLLFSVARHREVIEAWLRGLERRVAAGGAVDRLCSVASFFVSRVDGKVDPALDGAGAAGAPLRGTIAIANAAQAYAAFEAAFRGPRWEALAARGAQVQRPLWASTSTKDPKYPDTHYVEALVAPRTVNTLPPETFAAYRDHGRPAARIREAMAAAPDRLARLAGLGVDLAQVTDFLEADGIEKFAASYRSLLERIQAKAGQLAGTA